MWHVGGKVQVTDQIECCKAGLSGGGETGHVEWLRLSVEVGWKAVLG